MRSLRQMTAVIALNLRTIPARLSSSAVAIIGIAGVVVVFVSVLSIGAGFSAAMRGIEPVGMDVREEVSIVEGRMFEFGTTEVVVGRAASGQFMNMRVGDTI